MEGDIFETGFDCDGTGWRVEAHGVGGRGWVTTKSKGAWGGEMAAGQKEPFSI